MRWLPTLLCLFCFAAFGQEAAATDAHAEDGKALRNIDLLLRQMDAGATVTWQNGDVSRGHADIKAYYERMMKVEGKVAIDEAKKGLWFAGLGGLSGGLLLGWFLDRMRQRFLRFFVKIRSGV